MAPFWSKLEYGPAREVVGEGDFCKFVLLTSVCFAFGCSLPHLFKSVVTILLSPLSSELFYTERAHVRTLKVLHNVFYQRVTREGILNSSDKRKIFSNLEDILGLHGKSSRGAFQLCSLSWDSGYKYLKNLSKWPWNKRQPHTPLQMIKNTTAALPFAHSSSISDLQRYFDTECACPCFRYLLFLICVRILSCADSCFEKRSSALMSGLYGLTSKMLQLLLKKTWKQIWKDWCLAGGFAGWPFPIV